MRFSLRAGQLHDRLLAERARLRRLLDGVEVELSALACQAERAHPRERRPTRGRATLGDFQRLVA